jgi:hypothetical protein
MLKLKSSVRLIDDENGTFLLDTRRGGYWHLNPVAMAMVQALMSEPTVEDVVGQVVAEFEVDAETVREDVTRLVRDLKRSKLVEER